jgi:hypothetical protein
LTISPVAHPSCIDFRAFYFFSSVVDLFGIAGWDFDHLISLSFSFMQHTWVGRDGRFDEDFIERKHRVLPHLSGVCEDDV